MANSNCIYCNSDSFGSPCLFSPTNTHVHFGSGDRCIYCGSSSQGSGCVYNPYNKIHIRGPEFLNRKDLQTEKTLMLKYMISKLDEEFDTSYKSPLDRFYKRITHLIAGTSEPFLEALRLSESSAINSTNKQQILDAYKFQTETVKILQQLKTLIKEANLILPPEMVEESLINAVLSEDED